MADSDFAIERIAVDAYTLALENIQTKGVLLDSKTRDAIYGGIKFTLLYLWEAVLLNNRRIFTENVSWYMSTKYVHHFPEYLFAEMFAVVRKCLPKYVDGEKIAFMNELLESTIVISKGNAETDSFLALSGDLREISERYLALLLDLKRDEAKKLILEIAPRSGEEIRLLYSKVLQPVQYETGRLWQLGAISVAQEHFCTSVTAELIDHVVAEVPRAARHEKVFLGMCVKGEQHTIGIQMVSNQLALSGWSALNMHGSNPIDGIVQILGLKHIHCVGISVTMPYHFSLAAQYIDIIRTACHGDSPKIIVGGLAFNNYSDVWEKIGADGYSANADEALELAESLLA